MESRDNKYIPLFKLVLANVWSKLKHNLHIPMSKKFANLVDLDVSYTLVAFDSHNPVLWKDCIFSQKQWNHTPHRETQLQKPQRNSWVEIKRLGLCKFKT